MDNNNPSDLTKWDAARLRSAVRACLNAIHSTEVDLAAFREHLALLRAELERRNAQDET